MTPDLQSTLDAIAPDRLEQIRERYMGFHYAAFLDDSDIGWLLNEVDRLRRIDPRRSR